MRLNLGCSDRHLAGYVNVDICLPADQIADLTQRWPWEDSSVDEVVAEDIFEHLPDKIHTMNELWRVLKPNARVVVGVPTTDGRGAWQDPTHRSWWTPNDLFYYEYNNPHLTRFAKAYGMKCAFRIVSQRHELFPDRVWKLTAVLEAVK